MANKIGIRYPEEFKQDIAHLYYSGMTVKQIAKEYGLVERTVYKWIKLYSWVGINDKKRTVSIEEYKALQKRMVQLEKENKTLKKVTFIFASNNEKY